MSRYENIPRLGANKHIGDHAFLAAPDLPLEQPGFERVVSKITAGTPFLYCTLPPVFWTELAKNQLPPATPSRLSGADCKEKSVLQTVPLAGFSERDFARDILDWFQRTDAIDDSQIIVPNRAPCLGLKEAAATSWEAARVCEAFVAPRYIQQLASLGFSGHEMTVAMITGKMRKILDALRRRTVITVTETGHAAFVNAITCENHISILVDAPETNHSADLVKDRLLEAVFRCEQTDRLPPVVLSSAGGALATWLGVQVWNSGADVQYIDLGEALHPFQSKTQSADWIVLFQQELSKGLARILGPDHDATRSLRSTTGIRQPDFVSLAAAHGVPLPVSVDEIPAPMPERPVPFIENKIYDHSRIDDYLSVSVKRNHHANGGPVSAVLEEMVAAAISLPENREVVAVSNGTSALQLAAATHGMHKPQMRWVSSAFNFFSCGIGHLANTQIIDCDVNGRFDLDALKALPEASYDGVIYTNVFAQQTDWDAVADFCRDNGKAFVVDNATGLLDRPSSALRSDAPIEAISAHHTKPWGVGEGGFVICNKEQAHLIRKLANFGASLSAEATPWAANAKLSDLAAAAILDRLERCEYWSRFYKYQERRMHFIAEASNRGITEFGDPTPVLSPRAHTPFLAPHPVDVLHPNATGPVTIAKYYKPMRTNKSSAVSTPNADDLFARVFCLSNAPEMRTVSNGEIIEQVRRLIDAF
ncbi:DegT/DnrJ/EryC1/StrS family aminotransferase [Leisingera sp. McT4-56]|uniref:DegT/DnrJ/EryC1/StrS family aminotransferase n=1 Tax=Leisingera sp. McT4-56 TaxID=2881255 RepID=UPI001CF7F6B0|nr:DegT/DnrJ/EryC1/StrS family aminotransferase [Leisingera sp. McT4-56]MCB4456738.1 DegT/DnrJ/EryC1/StrS family aminotransferase [Leisingera sp. McT4-56]